MAPRSDRCQWHVEAKSTLLLFYIKNPPVPLLLLFRKKHRFANNFLRDFIIFQARVVPQHNEISSLSAQLS